MEEQELKFDFIDLPNRLADRLYRSAKNYEGVLERKFKGDTTSRTINETAYYHEYPSYPSEIIQHIHEGKIDLESFEKWLKDDVYKDGELLDSILNFLESVEEIRHEIKEGHPLRRIIDKISITRNEAFSSFMLSEGKSVKVGSQKRSLALSVLSFMSFGSIVKTVVQSVDMFSRFRMTELDRAILSESQKYLNGGIIKYLEDAIDIAIKLFLGVEKLSCISAKNTPISDGCTPSNNLLDMLPAADMAYQVHSEKTPSSMPSRFLDPVYISFSDKTLSPILSLAKGLKGFVGFDNTNNAYVLAFRGTNPKSAYNIFTDIHQILYGADLAYLMSIGILSLLMRHAKKDKNAKIHVVGHSLGGGMAQFATLAVCGDNINCYCYNSAGLSNNSVNQLKNTPTNKANIEHLHADNDIVFAVGNQYGKAIELQTNKGPYSAHLIKTLRAQTQKNDIYWMS